MPAWSQAQVSRAAKGLRLAVDTRRQRFGSGQRLGAGPGASLEFHDHRAYVAGDDPRHIDWRVYARSEQVVIRRYRQEVAPRVELLVDLSASLGLSPAKAELATALTALLVELAEACGSRPALMFLRDRVEPVPRAAWRVALQRAVCSGSAGLGLTRVAGLAAGAERILISDGLVAAGGRPVVERLGAGAGRISLVQVLTREELEPQPTGAVQLRDVEGGVRDLVLDAAACQAYRDRLARHQAGWLAALHGRGAGLVTCVVEEGFEAAVKRLLQAGLVEVSR